MTDEETLKELCERGTKAADDYYETVKVEHETLKSLIGDSRDLRSLVEALPKCMDDDPCEAFATMLWRFDGSRLEEFYCDRHGPLWMIDLGSKLELPYAAVLRDILASELRNV